MLATDGTRLHVQYDDPAQRDGVFPDQSEASGFQYSTVHGVVVVLYMMRSVQLSRALALTDSPTRSPLWRRQYVRCIHNHILTILGRHCIDSRPHFVHCTAITVYIKTV